MYVRVFHDLWESSLMAESVPVRWLFITMLGMADRSRSGILDVPLFILARQAGMSEGDTRAALEILMTPDPISRSEKEGGRRVVSIRTDQPDRGWEIVNWEDYAGLLKAADRREKIRVAVANHRAKKKVSDGNQPSTDVITCTDSVIKKHGGEEGKGSSSSEVPSSRTLSASPEVLAEPDTFTAFWTAYPRKVKRPRALSAWKHLSAKDKDAALAGLPAFLARTDPAFTPHPASWLNARQWEDQDDPLAIAGPKPRVVIHKNQGDLDREREGDEIARNRAADVRRRVEREAEGTGHYPPTSPEENAEDELYVKQRLAEIAAAKGSTS